MAVFCNTKIRAPQALVRTALTFSDGWTQKMRATGPCCTQSYKALKGFPTKGCILRASLFQNNPPKTVPSNIVPGVGCVTNGAQ